MYDMSLIGTVMKWEDIKKEFPNRWTLLTDCVKDTEGDLISARLLAFCVDSCLDDEFERICKQIGGTSVISMRRTSKAIGARW